MRLRSWPLRSKVAAVLAAPVAALVVVASFAVGDKVRAAGEGSEVGRLAEVTTLVTRVADELQAERTLVGGLVEDPDDTIQRTRFDLQTGLTNVAVRNLADAVNADADGAAARFQDTVREALAPLSGLPELRSSVLEGDAPDDPLSLYTDAVSILLDANDQVVALTDDERLSRQVGAYVALSRYKELVSQERAALYAIFTNGSFREGEYFETASRVAAQEVLLQNFLNIATDEQAEMFEETVTGTTYSAGAVESVRTKALADPTAEELETPPSLWLGVADGNIELIAEVEDALAADVTEAAADQESSSRAEALLYGAGALAIVLFSLGFAVLIARSIVGPLRRLTEAALQVRDELPRVVEQIKEPGDAASHFEPIKVESQDEVGRLAAAFNGVHDVAVEVASEQASLRASISDMVLNLARRNQSLLDRQLQYLDDLEDAETDPDSLQDLFTLDHLATRMRRNAESLLVLAGADPSRRRREPVAVADVIRAAGSEVEDYARIDIVANSPLAVSGSAAASVAHLLAELLENATSFSPPGTRVNVVTEQAGEAVRVVIADHGLGMSEEELADANDRLARPAMIDVALSRQLGFSVVARVADRFGIRVRLAATPEGGVTATVVLPPSILTAQGGSEPEAPASSNGSAATASAVEVGPSSMDDALPSAPESPEGLEELPTGPTEIVPSAELPAPPAPEEPAAEAPAPEAPAPESEAPAPEAPPVADAPQAPKAPEPPKRPVPQPRQAPQQPAQRQAPQQPAQRQAPQQPAQRQAPQRPAPQPAQRQGPQPQRQAPQQPAQRPAPQPRQAPQPAQRQAPAAPRPPQRPAPQAPQPAQPRQDAPVGRTAPPARPQPRQAPSARPAPKPAAARPAEPAKASGQAELTPAGLPRRTRKAPLATAGAAASRAAAPAPAPKIERSPDQLRAMLSRFQQGTQSGRTQPSDLPFQPTEDAT